MNKETFIRQIRKEFAGVDPEELDDLLHDYQEHFELGLADGRSEEEIASSLGSPRVLARQYRAECRLQEAKRNTTPGNVLRALLAAMALGLFNIIVMLGPIAAFFGILIALFAVSIALAGTGVALLLAAVPFFSGALMAAAVSGAFMLGSLGVALFILTLLASRLFGSLLVRYIQKNVDIIKNN